MSIHDRLKKINYQFLNNIEFEPTDEQRVMLANAILKSQLLQAEKRGEDITDTSENISSLLGVNVTWDVNNIEGDGYTINLGGINISQDADDPLSEISAGFNGSISGSVNDLPTGDMSVKVLAYPSDSPNLDIADEASSNFPNAHAKTDAVYDSSARGFVFDYNMTITEEDNYVVIAWGYSGDITNGWFINAVDGVLVDSQEGNQDKQVDIYYQQSIR